MKLDWGADKPFLRIQYLKRWPFFPLSPEKTKIVFKNWHFSERYGLLNQTSKQISQFTLKKELLSTFSGLRICSKSRFIIQFSNILCWKIFVQEMYISHFILCNQKGSYPLIKCYKNIQLSTQKSNFRNFT